MSDKVLMYTFPTPGKSVGFGRAMVTLKGFDKIESKDSQRLHELMNEIKRECQKLEVHFKAEIYETADISVKLHNVADVVGHTELLDALIDGINKEFDAYVYLPDLENYIEDFAKKKYKT